MINNAPKNNVYYIDYMPLTIVNEILSQAFPLF